MPRLFLNRHRTCTTPLLRAIRVVLVFVGLGVIAHPAEAQKPKRHFFDESDFIRLGAEQPHARALLEQGEAMWVQGDARGAISPFEEGVEEAPHSALLARRLCQALLESGERNRALAACRRAMQRQASPLDMRALVRVLVSGETPPNFDELHEATLLASRALQSMPHQPWGYAASCDIARRLGDAAMLDACRRSLERVAPGHAETRRAFVSVQSTQAVFAIAAGWMAIALVAGATLMDWMRRRGRAPHSDTSPRAERAEA